MKQKIFYTIAVGVLVAVFVSTGLLRGALGTPAAGEIQNYYSGDAAANGANIVIVSVNAGALELFVYDGKSIARQVTVAVPVSEGEKKFLDVALARDNLTLYAYAVNGRYLFKYDVSSPANPVLVSKVKHNDWDWFMRVQSIDGYIVTVGTQAVRLWSPELVVINEYANPKKSAFMRLSADGRYLFDMQTDIDGNSEDDTVRVINTTTRQPLVTEQIVLNKEVDRYPAVTNSFAYMPGDRVLKQINLVDRSIRNFAHDSGEGFSVASSADGTHVYFANGRAITKLNTQLNAVATVHADAFEVPLSWAVKVRVVTTNNAERVVVFNNSNIAVLNAGLDVLAVYRSPEITPATAPAKQLETLALALNTYIITKGRALNVSGASFAPGEEVAVTFTKHGTTLGAKVVTRADMQGRFRAEIAAPSEFARELVYKLPDRIDVRAAGVISERHISTTLTVTE